MVDSTFMRSLVEKCKVINFAHAQPCCALFLCARTYLVSVSRVCRLYFTLSRDDIGLL